MPTCKLCGKLFAYDEEHGYTPDLCSPICDGIQMERKSQLAAQPALQRQAFLAGAIWMHEEHLHRPLERDAADAQAEAKRRYGGGK